MFFEARARSFKPGKKDGCQDNGKPGVAVRKDPRDPKSPSNPGNPLQPFANHGR